MIWYDYFFACFKKKKKKKKKEEKSRQVLRGESRPSLSSNRYHLNGTRLYLCLYLGKGTPQYHVHEFRRQVEPSTSSSRIGIKFDAPVSKNISCIPMTMPFESDRKRSENERALPKVGDKPI